MSQSHHVRNGVFVVTGIALIVLLLSAFGLFRTAASSRRFETYVEESAQGLSAGSTVRFRGVPVGTVESIGFVWSAYRTPLTDEGLRQGRYTRIVFTIKREFLPDGEPGAPTVQEMVSKGLRVNIRNQGITGLRYLDLDVVSESARDRVLPVSWIPIEEYIPAAPSLTQTFANLLENIGAQLSGADFSSFVSNANAAALSIHASADEGAPAFGRAMRSFRNAAAALESLATALRDDPTSLLRKSDDE